MAVQVQTRVDRPQQRGVAGGPGVVSRRADSPRVLLRLPDFRARQPRTPTPPPVYREVENYEGAPTPVVPAAPLQAPTPAKVRRPLPWKQWLLTSDGHSRLAGVWRSLGTMRRLLALLWREPKLWMAILGALGLQAAAVVAFLNMGSAPSTTSAPNTAPPVPALIVQPAPLLPLQPAATAATPAASGPLQTPLSPSEQPKPTPAAMPAPTMLPTPAVREPVIPSNSPRLGDPNDKLPWEDSPSLDRLPSAGPASNSSAAANQPAMLPEGITADAAPPEFRTAAKPNRAKLKGTIQKLNTPTDGNSSPTRLY